ncbi:unnamed protein product [Arctogadus glacialis]
MMNRNRLLWEEKKRVRIVDSIRKYWAEHREKKEALRVKGELRYQQWAAKTPGGGSSGWTDTWWWLLGLDRHLVVAPRAGQTPGGGSSGWTDTWWWLLGLDRHLVVAPGQVLLQRYYLYN